MPARRRVFCPREGCTKSYLNVGDRDDHVSWEHDHIARHKCPECSLAFGSKSNFRRHQENVHAKKRFQCTLCGQVADMRPDNFKRQHKAACTNPPANGDWKGVIKPLPVATAVTPDQDQMVLDPSSFEPQSEAFKPAEAVPSTAEEQAREFRAHQKCELFELIWNICTANSEPGLIRADHFLEVQAGMTNVIDLPHMGGWTYDDLCQFALNMDLN